MSLPSNLLFLLFSFSLTLTYSAAADWQPTDLSPYSSEPLAETIWFRCRIQVPDRLVVPEANNPRDLWRSSTMLVIADLPSPFEVFLNAESIITSKGVPAGSSERFKVPKDILRAKEFNTLIIRVDKGGHALTKPPLLIDYFNELPLGPAWESTTAGPPPSDFKPSPDRPTSPAIYTEAGFRPSYTPLDPTINPVHGKRVPPAEALTLLKTDDDLTVDPILHEPQIAQPTHISWDARGRMWVSQYRQYPFPKGVKMVARDQYYRSKYDQVPPAPPHHDPGADIISVHEDTDGDGNYDKHTNVLTGLNMANAAVRGWGGLWVMHTPYLLFYPDADGDDIPDADPEVRLAGFGLEDTHSVANGLIWGPDGWLYGGQGSTTTSRITRPDIDPKDAPGIYNEGCLIWRYHPRTKAFEIFADGGGNVFGLSFDDGGRLFTGHNGGDTRGWHHVQEGQFLKQGVNPGKFGPPPNPYAFGELPMMTSTNPVPRFSHMLAPVAGTAMPARLHGQFLCLDPLHHNVIAAKTTPVGSTYQTTDTGVPLQTDDLTFRPVFLANAPDGSIAIADFREEYIAHGQNYQGQIDPDSGRIYRLRSKAHPLEADLNLESKSGAELVQTLSHPNQWHRHTAARLLGQRSDASTISALNSALTKPELHPALESLWSLHQMGHLDEQTATEALSHPAPSIRAWTIRLMGDSQVLPPKFLAALLALAATEPDPQVRCQILSTARRLEVEPSLAIIAAMPLGAEDVDDPYIPLMLWFAIESHCAANRDAVLTLFQSKASTSSSPQSAIPDPKSFWSRPVVAEHIVPRLIRRFAEAGTRADFLTCALILDLAPTPEAEAKLLAAFDDAFLGRVPPEFPDVLLARLGTGTLSMGIRQQKPEAITKGLALLTDPAAPEEERLSAVRAFGTLTLRDALSPLLKIATDLKDPLQPEALSALQIYDDPIIGETLIAKYESLPPPSRTSALSILTSRPGWAIQLLESETILREQLEPDLISRVRLHGNEKLDALLATQFSASGSASAATVAPDAIRAILAAKPGDPYKGEPIYSARCASCHVLFFKGGQVGPDLTRYQRDDLGTMLASILDPSADIREGYENYFVETKDGRILSGFLSEEDANSIVLRGFDGSMVSVPRTNIKVVTPVPTSLMPKGLLAGLSDQELRDFFAYLRLSQPIKP